MNVNLHIERLILDGVGIDPQQRHSLQSAVEQELAQLLTTGGLASALTGGGAVPRVAGPSIQLGGVNSPGELGSQIAHSVYRGIGK